MDLSDRAEQIQVHEASLEQAVLHLQLESVVPEHQGEHYFCSEMKDILQPP